MAITAQATTVYTLDMDRDTFLALYQMLMDVWDDPQFDALAVNPVRLAMAEVRTSRL